LTSFRVDAYCENPADTSGYNNDSLSVLWTTLDTSGPKTAAGTSHIFVAVAEAGKENVFVLEDMGATSAAVLPSADHVLLVGDTFVDVANSC
jgi:hypothetical protein